jgi:hypothetical protein
MYKCIYDLTTNKVIAVCTPEQNLESFIANWTNVAYVEVQSVTANPKNFNLKFDPITQTIIAA